MRRVFGVGVATVLVALVSATSSAETQGPDADDSAVQAERRGCCSHHGGVCGCGGQKYKCCDGTMSPTCACGSRSSETAGGEP